jgi:predicted MFS family arabinose efflux permease
MTIEAAPEPLDGPAEQVVPRPAGGPRAHAATTRRAHAAATRRPGGLLHHHDFRLLWAGETVSKGGSAVTTVALPLVAVLNLSAGPFAVGLLEAAAWLPWLLFSLPAGAWVDGWPRRPVMQVTNVISAALLVSVPVAAWLGVLGMPQLMVVAAGVGVAKVFFRPAFQAYLPSLVAADELREGNAKLHGSYSVADVAGPGLAGMLAQAFGAVNALLVDAASFVVSTLCLSRIRAQEELPADRRQNSGLLQRIGAGLRYVAGEAHLRALTLFAASSNLVLVATQVLLIIFLVRVVGVRPGTVGVLMASMGVGGVLGALATKRISEGLGTARGLLVAQAVAVPFGLLIPLTRPGTGLALFAIGNLVLSAGIVAGNVIGSAFRQSYCPHDMIGRVSAVTACLIYGSMPLGAVIGGSLGSGIGIRPALWVLAGALFLPLSFLLLSPIRTERDLPAAPR